MISTLGIEELARLAADGAERAEAERRVEPAFIAELRRQGLSRLAAPTRLGGGDPSPAELLGVVREVARADAAAGWVTMIYLTSAVASHWIPDAGQDEIWEESVLLAGVVAPRGEAHPKDGGYLLSGRWSFGSGAADSDWLGLGGVMNDSGKSAIFHLRRSEVEVIDTWDVLGLRASASHDLAVRQVSVPGHRISFLDGPPHSSDRVARFPVFGLLAAGIGAVAIGIGEAALTEVISIAGGKTPTGSKRRLADRAAVQEAVARSQADLEAAWEFLTAATRGRDQVHLEERVRLRLAATKATETGRQVVDRLYLLAGGTSLYNRSPLQRYLRDIHTATQHMMTAQPTWEVTGRVLLGLDDDPVGL